MHCFYRQLDTNIPCSDPNSRLKHQHLPLPRLPTPRTRRRRHLSPTRLLRRLQLLLHNHSRSLFPPTPPRLLPCSRCILLIHLPNQRNLSRKPLLERLSDEKAISVEPARKRCRQLPYSFSTCRIDGRDSDVVDRRMFRYG